MLDLIHFIHFFVIAITIGIPLLNVALGQKRASSMVIDALDEQPSAHQHLRFLFFLGAAMLEFSGILSLVMSIIFFSTVPTSLPGALAQLGAALAFVLPALMVGVLAAHPLAANIKSLAQQPLLQQKMIRLLLLTQIMLQTPILFGFVMSGLINASVTDTLSMTEAFKLLASGLTFGLGSMGPLLGLSLFARQACKTVGKYPEAYDNIFAFTFVSQGIIETPILFVFVISLSLWLITPSAAMQNAGELWSSIAYIMIACTMGLTTLPAGISSGKIAGSACQQIGMYAENYPVISRISLLGQVFIETNTIYGFIIVFIMLLSLP